MKNNVTCLKIDVTFLEERIHYTYTNWSSQIPWADNTKFMQLEEKSEAFIKEKMQ